MLKKANPTVCYVTDSKALAAGGEDLPVLIRRAIAAGVDWVQLREKDLPTRELLALARGALTAAHETHAKILVNDRLDVAVAAGAAGVHLGGESMPVVEVVRWRDVRFTLRSAFLVGASCHSLEQAQQAERDGADYIIFGPVFATPSKTHYGPPQGIARLEEICGALAIPVLAIGGVTLENAGTCVRAGAAGLAAIRLFQEAGDLPAVVSRLRSA